MRQAQALLGSVDGTLSDEVILGELEASAGGAPPFSEVFADNTGTDVASPEQ